MCALQQLPQRCVQLSEKVVFWFAKRLLATSVPSKQIYQTTSCSRIWGLEALPSVLFFQVESLIDPLASSLALSRASRPGKRRRPLSGLPSGENLSGRRMAGLAGLAVDWRRTGQCHQRCWSWIIGIISRQRAQFSFPFPALWCPGETVLGNLMQPASHSRNSLGWARPWWTSSGSQVLPLASRSCPVLGFH